MGSILVNVPDIPDTDLIFDEMETRRILKFFWPDLASRIDTLNIDNNARRLAQTALIAAVDGSYAMGFVEALLKSLSRPSKSLSAFGKKLARNFARHQFKHATQTDLEDVRIYENVRADIANALKTRFHLVLDGVALNRVPFPFALLQQTSGFVWS